MERWAGKSAIVTGAASGIGRAITIALLEKGVNVLALDVQTEKLSTLTNEWNANWGRICLMRCNISDEKDLKSAFDYLENNVEESWNGGVDIMVNNAGVIEYTRVIGKIIVDRNERKNLQYFHSMFIEYSSETRNLHARIVSTACR